MGAVVALGIAMGLTVAGAGILLTAFARPGQVANPSRAKLGGALALVLGLLAFFLVFRL